jgi:hypothetical protein
MTPSQKGRLLMIQGCFTDYRSLEDVIYWICILKRRCCLVSFCLAKGKCTKKHEREEGKQKTVLFTISPDLQTMGHKIPAASESELSTENAALKDCPGPDIFPLFDIIDLTLPANPIFGLLRTEHRCRLDHYQIQHLEHTRGAGLHSYRLPTLTTVY